MRVTPLEPGELDPASVERLQYISETFGFIPENWRVAGRHPELLQALVTLCEVVLPARKVTAELKWLVGHIASRAAGCRYCWAHTGDYAVSVAHVDVAKVEQAWEFECSPLFSDAERAALRLAAAAAVTPNAATDELFVDLHRYFDDDQIVEIVSVICLFGWYNRWNDTMGTPLEQSPLEFGRRHLAPGGWEPGHHAPSA